MKDASKTGLALIDAAEAELSARPWWTSRRSVDFDRRSYANTMLGELRMRVRYNQLDAPKIGRLLDGLKKFVSRDDDEFVITGYGVGFKKPRDGNLVWVDFPGVMDPLVASRMAAASDRGKALVKAGYREYGISPMKGKAPAVRPPSENQNDPSPAP